MRLKEQKLDGHFRFLKNDYRYPREHEIDYGDNEKGFRGQLTIKEDGSLLLELEGLKTNRLYNIFFQRGTVKFPRIDGKTSDGRYYIILLDCFFWGDEWHLGALKLYPKICLTQRSSQGERGKKSWYIFGPNKPVEFDKIRFCLDGIEEFVLPDLKGIEEAKPIYDDFECHQHGYAKKLKIEWNEPEPLEFKAKNFTFKIELKASGSGWSKTIGPKAYCVLEFPKPLSIEDWEKKVEAVKYFFGFLFDSRIGITNIYGYLTGQEIEILKEGERISGEVRKYPVYWNLYYENSEWEDEYKGYPAIRYQNFDKEGENQFGKYLESFINKFENDDDFELYFLKYVWRFFPSLFVDRFKSVADDCEYLFVKYNQSLPHGDRLQSKDKIRDPDKWKQIRLLAKPLEGCIFKNDNECVDFGKEIKKHRNANGITHYKEGGEKINFSKLNLLSRKLTVIAKFHFLNLLYKDSDLNCKLIKESKPYWIGPDRA